MRTTSFYLDDRQSNYTNLRVVQLFRFERGVQAWLVIKETVEEDAIRQYGMGNYNADLALEVLIQNVNKTGRGYWAGKHEFKRARLFFPLSLDTIEDWKYNKAKFTEFHLKTTLVYNDIKQYKTLHRGLRHLAQVAAIRGIIEKRLGSMLEMDTVRLEGD